MHSKKNRNLIIYQLYINIMFMDLSSATSDVGITNDFKIQIL